MNRAQLCGFLLVLSLLATSVLACGSEEATDSIPVVTTNVVEHETIPLRGANIYQRRTYR